MSTDAELLRRYLDERSEAAFSTLVQRHLNLVYFAALRQVGGDVHGAQDVAQMVFTDLARKAATLTGRATLTGWLHTSTRYAAAKARRADFSRQHYEQEATTMNALLHEPDPAAEWERLRPLIDDAVHELADPEREAVLLRFFEGRPFAEIGATFRVSEDAARMRVERALDKLRTALGRRGVTSTSAALGIAFANQMSIAAPAGLAAAISGAAFGSGSSGLVIAGAGFFMSNTSTAIVAAVALAAIGTTFYQWNHAQRAENELSTLALDRDGLRAQLRTEQARTARATQEAGSLQSEIQALKAKQAATPVAPARPEPVVVTPAPAPAPASIAGFTGEEIQKIRSASIKKTMTSNLRMIGAARNQFLLEHGRPPTSLQELVGPDKYIKQLNPVEGEDYSTISLVRGQPMTLTTSDGGTLSFDPDSPAPVRSPPAPIDDGLRERTQKITASVDRAVAAYRAANNGASPPAPERLVPYFSSPQEGADFVELIEAQKAFHGK